MSWQTVMATSGVHESVKSTPPNFPRRKDAHFEEPETRALMVGTREIRATAPSTPAFSYHQRISCRLQRISYQKRLCGGKEKLSQEKWRRLMSSSHLSGRRSAAQLEALVWFPLTGPRWGWWAFGTAPLLGLGRSPRLRGKVSRAADGRGRRQPHTWAQTQPDLMRIGFAEEHAAICSPPCITDCDFNTCSSLLFHLYFNQPSVFSQVYLAHYRRGRGNRAHKSIPTFVHTY